VRRFSFYFNGTSVEHDFAFLGQFVDTIYVMESGKMVVKGDYEMIKKDEKVREIYFG